MMRSGSATFIQAVQLLIVLFCYASSQSNYLLAGEDLIDTGNYVTSRSLWNEFTVRINRRILTILILILVSQKYKDIQRRQEEFVQIQFPAI